MRVFRLAKKPKPEKTEILAAVQDYLKEGISVFPGDPETKQPAVGEWKSYRTHLMTEAEVEEQFGLDKLKKNVLVCCGTKFVHKDGKKWYLLVLDFDDMKLYEKFPEYLKDTRTSLTGKGIHLWFYVLTPPRTRHLKKMDIPLDIQGTTAYIVAPPSWHEEKEKRYRWKDGRKRPIMKTEIDMERFIFDWLEESKLVPTKSFKAWKKLQTVHDIDRLLEGVEKGERDFAAIRISSWYCQGGLTREQALAKLQQWDLKNKPPMQSDPGEPADVLKIKVDSAYDNEYNYRFTRDMAPLDKEEIQPLTPELETFLKRPDLHDAIMCILDTVIVGEVALKALHFYVGIGTAFLVTPFGIIIIDVFGSGKSYTQKNTVLVFPTSRVDQPTSMSMKVVNYLAENYKGRILRIDELFGEEEGMPYIRVWMTEARLEHWVTDMDTHREKKIITEGCPVFFTSTTKTVEEQYGSRNWIANIDTSGRQTLGVHHHSYKHNALPKNFFKDEAEQRAFLTQLITWLMQNAKPVLIPMRFSFPLLPRSRRDFQQFSQLIMCVANVYQLQRQIKTFDGVEYIIAKREDFELALKIAKPFLYQTMKTLDKYGWAILRWAQKVEAETFCVRDFWNDNPHMHSFSYRTIQKRFDQLHELGYIEPAGEVVRYQKTWWTLTEMGDEDPSIAIEIIDDGKWLLDVYNRLDDPQVIYETTKRFQELLKKHEKKILKPPKPVHSFVVGKKAHDEEEIVKMLKEQKKLDSNS